MKRIDLVDLLNINKVLELKEDLWIDNVYYDIPETLVAVARRVPENVIAMTFHEHIWVLRHLYEELFEVCKKRGITMVKAKNRTYERIWPETG